MSLIRAWIAAAFWLALPAAAWNGTGHRIIAAIAWDHLTPQARAKVIALLNQHPDRATLLAGDDRAAFLAASTWPDQIRSDPRFYADTRENARPTPLLPGFPSMARHANWHYIDIPFSPDGTPLEQPQRPNALIELRRILKGIDAYDLPWLLHLEGDIHQPLHCTSRFVKTQPHGDRGGNEVFVGSNRTLHEYWDELPGEDAGDAYVTRVASELTNEPGARSRLSLDPAKWVDEGFRLAQREVYTFGAETGSRGHPLTLPAGYEAKARRTARGQLAIAGLRLAGILNRHLK